MQRDLIVDEFTHQAQTFDQATVVQAAQTLAAMVELVPAQARGRWVEPACGTGAVARALAPRVDEVVGVDLTPAMLDVARREATSAGLGNVRVQVGDATALPFADASFDGAVTRFSLHHIPVPGRVIAEMARVVEPGGLVIVGDHVTDDDGAAAAWHQEVERLRDPSHWSCLTAARIRELCQRAGLELEQERRVAVQLDFDDWLSRSSAGAEAAALVSSCLAERPAGTASFRLADGQLELQLSLSRWRRR